MLRQTALFIALTQCPNLDVRVAATFDQRLTFVTFSVWATWDTGHDKRRIQADVNSLILPTHSAAYVARFPLVYSPHELINSDKSEVFQ